MSYIKISDPNVIDLAAWQQVINVVNQHSDSITAITNNFGIQGTGETNWNGESNISNEYDPGSQKIMFGKYKFDPANPDQEFITAGNNVKYLYHGEILFQDEVSGTTSFDAKPVVTASISQGNQNVNATNALLVVTITAVTESGFTYRIVNPNSTSAVGIAITAASFINWMAIGPK